MTRRMFFSLSLLTIRGAGLAQFALPRIGFVRRRSGEVRVLHGVAGNFAMGEVTMSGVEELWFDGTRGIVRTAVGHLTLNERGEITGETEESVPVPGAYIDGDEVVVEASGRRLRLPFAVDSLERAGAEYVALTGEAGTLLLRIQAEQEALFQLPEVSE